MSVLFFKRPDSPDLAYKLREGKSSLPTVLFLGGFRSDMEGTKAVFLDELCCKREQSFVRFDYSGHGQSGGDFKDGTIGSWREDALNILDGLCTGPVILVGSSMGGWLSLLMARIRKDRIKGVVGLAAAPDFTREISRRMNAEQKAEMAANGFFNMPSEYSDIPYPITRGLLEDGEKHILLDGAIDVDCSVRLIQGMKDTDVPWQTAHRILNALTSSNKKVFLREEGDHRLSTAEDLAVLAKMIEEISPD